LTRAALRILQVSTYDTIGGAEKVAWNLQQSYQTRGHEAWLAVGHKLSNHPDTLLIPHEQFRGRWSRFWKSISAKRLPTHQQPNGSGRLRGFMDALAEPGKALNHYRGVEDFQFPGTWHLLKLTGKPVDIVHCHNLHGGYFDLRALPWLSRQVPLILTLHDAWLLSGHCAHSFDCERWKIGCGSCPDLRIEPPIRRDATSYNWKRKRAIYGQSRVYVSTPSQWLMEKIGNSMLAPAVVESRVIPNGVDRTIFHPMDKAKVRSVLNIPQNAAVLLFVAYNVRHNMWKNYQTLEAAVSQVAEQWHAGKLLFLSLGGEARSEWIGQAEIRFVPYQKDPATVARYYQAADVYVHAAKADTFPNTVLEALACGKPVVATAVGGIPEQIRPSSTGFLTPPGDAQTMASHILELLSNEVLRGNMSAEATEDARRRFDLETQVDTYLAWYESLIQRQESESRRRGVDALSVF
jgi:glycosyltransferase involved in cell wall biosynthesis